jgi:hypothetical protein
MSSMHEEGVYTLSGRWVRNISHPDQLAEEGMHIIGYSSFSGRDSYIGKGRKNRQNNKKKANGSPSGKRSTGKPDKKRTNDKQTRSKNKKKARNKSLQHRSAKAKRVSGAQALPMPGHDSRMLPLGTPWDPSEIIALRNNWGVQEVDWREVLPGRRDSDIQHMANELDLSSDGRSEAAAKDAMRWSEPTSKHLNQMTKSAAGAARGGARSASVNTARGTHSLPAHNINNDRKAADIHPCGNTDSKHIRSTGNRNSTWTQVELLELGMFYPIYGADWIGWSDTLPEKTPNQIREMWQRLQRGEATFSSRLSNPTSSQRKDKKQKATCEKKNKASGEAHKNLSRNKTFRTNVDRSEGVCSNKVKATYRAMSNVSHDQKHKERDGRDRGNIKSPLKKAGPVEKAACENGAVTRSDLEALRAHFGH